MVDFDGDLEQKVFSALRNDSRLARRDLRCENRQGRVILKGVVHSYYQKQVAQEIIRRVDGVQQIDNQLEVDWPPAELEAAAAC